MGAEGVVQAKRRDNSTHDSVAKRSRVLAVPTVGGSARAVLLSATRSRAFTCWVSTTTPLYPVDSRGRRCAGYQVFTAFDGDKPIAQAAPDVAVIDLFMPSINGFEVIRALRSAQGEVVELIASTANDSDSARQVSSLDEAHRYEDEPARGAVRARVAHPEAPVPGSSANEGSNSPSSPAFVSRSATRSEQCTSRRCDRPPRPRPRRRVVGIDTRVIAARQPRSARGLSNEMACPRRCRNPGWRAPMFTTAGKFRTLVRPV